MVQVSRGVRPRAARKSPAERAAEIRSSAGDLARTSGLSALTLRSVAARVGVAPALVAHYEPNMDELVASTFTAITTAEVGEIVEIIGEGATATEKLRLLIATLLEPSRDEVTAVWADAFSLGRINEALAAAVRAVMDSWQALVVGIIEEGTAAGEFTTDEPGDVAWQFLGMIDGVNAHALVHYAGAPDRGRLVRRAMEHELGLGRGALGGDEPTHPTDIV
ncbi:TetR family transcriptional regulator C-terminal domain-containing protein [Gordonia sp. VNQ95]|uniref:TetR/AcrR family transcriptional regulator n=1 Tax=Gordonia sp. VNQ95 TaxID=3156619 RepID=UPI0032B62398